MVNYMQVLDEYRGMYERETTGNHRWWWSTHPEYATYPTWEYVCWLERKIEKAERNG